MVTSLIEMLKLPNLVDDVMENIMTSQSILQNTSILHEPKVSIFADIIKIITMYIKTIFKDSKEFKS